MVVQVLKFVMGLYSVWYTNSLHVTQYKAAQSLGLQYAKHQVRIAPAIPALTLSGATQLHCALNHLHNAQIGCRALDDGRSGLQMHFGATPCFSSNSWGQIHTCNCRLMSRSASGCSQSGQVGQGLNDLLQHYNETLPIHFF